jgi:hypothetical protein
MVVDPIPTNVPFAGDWLTIMAPPLEQLSVTTTPPKKFGTAAVQVPSAEIVELAGQLIVGGVLSETVIANEHRLVPSELVTNVVPTGKKSPELTGFPLAVDVIAFPQLLVTVNCTFAPHCVLFGPVVANMLSGQVSWQVTCDLALKKAMTTTRNGKILRFIVFFLANKFSSYSCMRWIWFILASLKKLS